MSAVPRARFWPALGSLRAILSVVVPDKLVKRVVSTVIEVNQTGKAGDGKIFVLPVDESIRIRTGETGDETLDEA